MAEACGRCSVAATVPLRPWSACTCDENEAPDLPYPIAQSPFVPDLVVYHPCDLAPRTQNIKPLKYCVCIQMFRRKYLGHGDVPAEVAWDAHFSVVICALPRGANNLCFEPVGSGILNAGRHYEALEKWHVRLLLLMPDHLHLIVTPCLGHSLSPLIADWKRYLCRSYGIKFQRNFFDHRIRDTENFNAQCQYVRENPVRAGLVRRPEDWPWFYPRI